MEMEKLKDDQSSNEENPNNDDIEIEEKQSCKAKYKNYPKHVGFIIGNEFCERFSFYGMRTVLVLYARNFLMFDDDTATSMYHGFTFFAYFFPLIGGILADSVWGRYKTIAYLSIVYVLGHVVKTIAAIPYIPGNTTHIALSIVGLLLIAIGTGGIKPCVVTFGGDQFTESQVAFRSQYFALFYMSINAGALLSKVVTPMFRADLNCYPGETGPKFEECYAVAFGVPGLLMLLAVVFFFLGTKYYTRFAPTGSIFWKFCKCIYSALCNKWKTRKNKNDKKLHWVDYADASGSLKLDTKCVLRVLLLFTPLPFFWALFDQQGSRWTLQALKLDGNWGSYVVKPEQMDVINPLLIVTLIPLFEVALYPAIAKLNLNFTPIKKMALGLMLAGLSFVFAAILQFAIDGGMTPIPSFSQYSVRVVNVLPCDITLNSSSPLFNNLNIKSNGISETKSNFIDANITTSLRYQLCDGENIETNIEGNTGGHIYDIVIASQTLEKNLLTKQLENGRGKVIFLNALESGNLTIEIDGMSEVVQSGEDSMAFELPKGRSFYKVYETNSANMEYEGYVETGAGGIYSVILKNNSENVEAVEFGDGQRQLTDINSNNVNMAWMLPQYFTITVGEIFLSVTGLEFSYSQAPKSMKAVVSSFWLLTVSVGNVIVLTIANIKAIERQAFEFLLFSFLIWVACLIFMFLGARYKYVEEKDLAIIDKDTTKTDPEEPLMA